LTAGKHCNIKESEQARSQCNARSYTNDNKGDNCFSAQYTGRLETHHGREYTQFILEKRTEWIGPVSDVQLASQRGRFRFQTTETSRSNVDDDFAMHENLTPPYTENNCSCRTAEALRGWPI